MLCHRRMSSQEAAYRFSNLKLIHTSRKFIYIYSRIPKKRFKMLKSKKEIECLENDCTDILQSNLIDYYRCRPTELENMCAFTFCSWYSKCYDPPSKRERYRNSRIYIANHDLWMRTSKIPCVVRTPTFSVFTDDYYYNFLFLLIPHRAEVEVLQPYENAKYAFDR